MEERILLDLQEIFSKHAVDFNFQDYQKLIEQFQVLPKKSSNKDLRELGKVQDLKKEMIDKMPELA